MKSIKKNRFIIVGGGIGGLASALGLAQQGINSIVLEKASKLGEIGAGIQLGCLLPVSSVVSRRVSRDSPAYPRATEYALHRLSRGGSRDVGDGEDVLNE